MWAFRKESLTKRTQSSWFYKAAWEEKSQNWVLGTLFIVLSFVFFLLHFQNNDPRVVLIVDLWHPELDEQTRASLSPIWKEKKDNVLGAVKYVYVLESS